MTKRNSKYMVKFATITSYKLRNRTTAGQNKKHISRFSISFYIMGTMPLNCLYCKFFIRNRNLRNRKKSSTELFFDRIRLYLFYYLNQTKAMKNITFATIYLEK